MKSRRLSKQKRAFPESGRFGERDGQRVVEGEGDPFLLSQNFKFADSYKKKTASELQK